MGLCVISSLNFMYYNDKEEILKEDSKSNSVTGPKDIKT